MTEDIMSRETPLPFPHGIEIELQLLRRDGSWISGKNVLEVFDRLISAAKVLLDGRIKESGIPIVKRKYRHSAQTEEGERGSRIVASYMDPTGVHREYTLIGHDPNVTSITWILEVATPPCTTLEELIWWTHNMIAVAQEALESVPDVIMVSTGLNPTQEYVRNLSFGEHHHILGPTVSEGVRIGVYNMIRNFLPHIIALSVNSPFENKRPTDEVHIDHMGRTRAPRCVRSIRLMKNTTQLGPASRHEMIPYMTTGDKEEFARRVARDNPRMVDICPFTDKKTIEVRVADTQLSIPRHIGLALLIQALALKASRMLERGQAIPDVGNDSLAKNRETAISAGLWGRFEPSSSEEDPQFVLTYNHLVTDDGRVDETRTNRYMSDALVSMLFLIREEIEELGLVDNPLMHPLLVSVFGNETWEPRTTGADFQLDVYARSDENLVILLQKLVEITRDCCKNWLYDPVGGMPDFPTWLHWWKGVQPTIAIETDRTFAGSELRYAISVKNTSGKRINNLVVLYSIEDNLGNPVDSGNIHIPSLEAGEAHISHLGLSTKVGISAYNMIVRVLVAGREIVTSSTVNMYWIRASIRPVTTAHIADGETPVLFSGEIETDYRKPMTFRCTISLVDTSTGTTLRETTSDVTVDSGHLVTFTHEKFPPLIVDPYGLGETTRCVFGLKLSDADGREYASVVSKPFYLMARATPARVRVAATGGPVWQPGDRIGIRVSVENVGRVSPDTVVSVVFVSWAGTEYAVADSTVGRLNRGNWELEWTVPFMPPGQPLLEGVLRARLTQGAKTLSSADTNTITIVAPRTTMRIESLRLVGRPRIGEEIVGWMRISRSNETGEPSELLMYIKYPGGDSYELLRLHLKPTRNLSLKFGPLPIPEPPAHLQPVSAELVAELSLSGDLLDRAVAVVQLDDKSQYPMKISIGQLQDIVNPDELFTAVVEVVNDHPVQASGILTVTMESVAGTETLVQRVLEMSGHEKRMISVTGRIPISLEMNTAYLVATVSSDRGRAEARHKFRVRAMESPVMSVSFSLRGIDGRELIELVPRGRQMRIVATLKKPRPSMRGLVLRVSLMKYQDIVLTQEFQVGESDSPEEHVSIGWTAPNVETITPYYLVGTVLQAERELSPRVVKVTTKRFTVY